MNKNIYRINDFSLFKVNDFNNSEFLYKVKDEISASSYQYFDIATINNIVWDSGTFEHKINKIYSSLALYTPELPTEPTQVPVNNCSILLKQGFNWTNLFGLLVNVVGSVSGDVLVSQIVNIDDVNVSENIELINGSFFNEEIKIVIPKVNEILLVEITKISYDNIASNDGFIYNYPINFTPLISEKPIPDYIQLRLSFDNNHYLALGAYTTENKTLEQSILDYFDVEVANISIDYIINYGIESIGFYSMRISNELNKFQPLKVGLDLSQFSTPTNDNIVFFVQCEIYVDGKLIKREATLTTTILETLNPLIENKITHPETNYPVTVDNQTVTNNTIIETKEITKITPIYQLLFAEMIKDNFIYEQKTISFPTVTIDCYLRILKSANDEEQLILNKRTVDNVVYFDLSELYQLTAETTYEIIDKSTSAIIGRGSVLLK